jgi:CRP-like cAMP-binding protein
MQVRLGDRELGRIPAGHTVGEIALLDAEPRSADVVALADSEVVELAQRPAPPHGSQTPPGHRS